ncbi:hypothetical protein UFOVP117_100 [uncultured Caudovirales phage]|uniref:Uncharacterized protein n=1 Tax=uncultured Caudovirales phage TaxID=2100421 RepID=A0A6J5L968_9CAUD|nr:hypothetical protein UFOVP117_100 [uncultured Caudovirales phage]
MKKFILSLVLVLSTLLSFSQEVGFARATELYTGYRDENQEIVWNGSPSSVDILIKLEDDKVTIFSQQTQVYRVVGKIRDEDSYITYRMLDSQGGNCNFHMGPSETQGYIFIAIEYNDYAWMYLTKLDD